MRLRIYLDTHFIDYLFDHRGYIWDGKRASLDRARRNRVGDDQLDEYELLGVFPDVCWLNDWWLRVGERVFEELGKIRSAYRRRRLQEYARQLSEQATYEPWYDDDEDSAVEVQETVATRNPFQYSMLTALGFADDFPLPESLPMPPPFDALAQSELRRTFPRSPEEAVSRLPKKDRPLVEEALALGCDVFLTTDKGILDQAALIEERFGLRIRTWTQLVDDEAELGRLRLPGQPSGDLWPDLEIYTKLIPAV